MILVTGATGFLGSTVLDLLLKEGAEVIACKRETSTIPFRFRSSTSIKWVDVDVRDYFSLLDIFKGVRQVYHCAAMISYQPKEAEEMMSINVDGTKHIVDLCLQHNVRMLHVSSIASLGNNKHSLTSEKDKWEYDSRNSAYALSKYYSEMEVWRGIVEGLDAVIVNPSVIMGIACGEKGSGQIFSMVRKGLRVYPTGTVGLVAVEDVAHIMIQLMESPLVSGERYILNSENISNKELLHKISILLNKKSPSISADRWMLGIAWRLSSIISLVFNKKPALTKDSARASIAKLSFSNAKIKNLIQYNFKPVEEILREITKHIKSTQTI